MANANKTLNGIIIVGIIAAAAGGAFIFFTSKDHYARIIFRNGKNHDLNFLRGLDKIYLKAWAKAIKAGEETFQVGSTTFFTQGGKKKV